MKIKKISKKEVLNLLDKQLEIAYSIVGFDDDKLDRIPTEKELLHFEIEIRRGIVLVTSEKVRDKLLELTGVYFEIIRKLMLKTKLEES